MARGIASARHPNKLIHMADALRSAQNFGNKATIPILGPAGDLLIGDAQSTAEKLAYGDRIHKGRGMTTSYEPGLVDLAALSSIPAAAVKGSIGAGANLAQKTMAAALRRPILGRRDILKKMAVAPAAGAAALSGVKLADELLTPAAKATAAPVARKAVFGGKEFAEELIGALKNKDLLGWRFADLEDMYAPTSEKLKRVTPEMGEEILNEFKKDWGTELNPGFLKKIFGELPEDHWLFKANQVYREPDARWSNLELSEQKKIIAKSMNEGKWTGDMPAPHHEDLTYIWEKMENEVLDPLLDIMIEIPRDEIY